MKNAQDQHHLQNRHCALSCVLPAVQNSLLQVANIYRPRKISAFPEFFRREPETFG
jgi:hypothetical protein